MNLQNPPSIGINKEKKLKMALKKIQNNSLQVQRGDSEKGGRSNFFGFCRDPRCLWKHPWNSWTSILLWPLQGVQLWAGLRLWGRQHSQCIWEDAQRRRKGSRGWAGSPGSQSRLAGRLPERPCPRRHQFSLSSVPVLGPQHRLSSNCLVNCTSCDACNDMDGAHSVHC